MSSRLATLAWEIWCRGSRSARLAFGCVAGCALINLIAQNRFSASDFGPGLFNSLFGLLMACSLFLMMGVFNYTEFSSTREWNGFPYRLFTLPLRTWQLVALPMFLGVVSVELLYLAWIKLVWTHDSIVRPEWFAVVLGAYMIFYQAALWSLAGFRIVRLLVLSLGGVSSIAVACLPMFDEVVPSPWFSETRLIAILLFLAFIAFIVAWRTVARQRCGGGLRRHWIKILLERITDALPRRAKDFSSPAAAQFWFEWRRAGLLLPVCTSLVLAVIFGPFSWFCRNDPQATVDLLLRILLMPLVLAFCVGKAFVKPELWSTDFALPPFLAVRPLSAGEFVISKLKVATLSVAATWLLIVVFIALWLPLWADDTNLNGLMVKFRMLYPQSWQTIIILYFAGFVVLTWRCLVSGLWIGLCGNRSYYVAASLLQVITVALLLLAAGILSDTIDVEIRDNPVRLISIALSVTGWLLTIAVIVKLWFAVFSWSKITPRCAWQYIFIWLFATLGFVVLGILSRPWADTHRLEHLYVLAAFLIFPFARLGLAPLSLAKNRHQ